MITSVHSQLTTLVTSPSDLKRARRELETVDDFLNQAGLRQGGKAVKLPVVSRVLQEIVTETNANLLHTVDRAQLLKYISQLIEQAPVLHISFASDPSAAFTAKLVGWLRANIHPQALVQVGLQPSIAAGCIVRTANKQFDFSLAKAFSAQQQLLLTNLRHVAPPEAVTDFTAPTPDQLEGHNMDGTGNKIVFTAEAVVTKVAT